jgi:hypothetical protein
MVCPDLVVTIIRIVTSCYTACLAKTLNLLASMLALPDACMHAVWLLVACWMPKYAYIVVVCMRYASKYYVSFGRIMQFKN